MNANVIPPQVRTDAQRWFLRLQSTAIGSGERAAFERWRAENPSHAAAYRAVEQVWHRAAAVNEDPSMAEVLHRARRLPPEPAFGRRAWPVLAVAACLVLAVGLGYRLGWMPEQVPIADYATAAGEQRSVQLEDGSTVVLDTRSRLQVQYGKRERRLTLLSGQADFHVRSDAARPFVVHAGVGAVTAMGTQFQVRLGDDAGTVTLLEGQVAVDVAPGAGAGSARRAQNDGRALLQPGERIAFRPDGTLGPRERLVDTELAQARGWTEGTLVVREWPLSRLVAEMNRYTDTPFRLDDPDLGDMHISGSFRPDDRESFLLSLEYGWPISVDRDRPDEIVLRRK